MARWLPTHRHKVAPTNTAVTGSSAPCFRPQHEQVVPENTARDARDAPRSTHRHDGGTRAPDLALVRKHERRDPGPVPEELPAQPAQAEPPLQAPTEGSADGAGNEPVAPLPAPVADPPALIDDEEEEQDEASTPDEQAEFDRLIAEIEARCKAGGVKYEAVTQDRRTGLRVLLPAGRDHRPVPVMATDAARQLLRVPFEKLVILSPYWAACSYETRSITALVTGISVFGIRPLPRQWQRQAERGEGDKGPYATYADNADGQARTIEVGPCSDELAVLDSRPFRLTRSTAIRISGFSFTTFDRARAILEEVSDAFFFDVDLKTNSAMALARDPGLPRSRVAARTRWSRDRDAPVAFPRARYDREPMSLYWYGRQARGMPLLEFLAYYQCVEFHFPTYAEAEAQKRVRNVLKDPAFNPSKDADIARIVQILGARKGVGDERTQLKATMTACVDPDALRGFFTDEDQTEFFSKKTDLSARTLPLGRADADLREAVADRIYDIRCKIVHTKESEGADLLLPFSKEASLLAWDIALMQFVARSVLIASSRLI